MAIQCTVRSHERQSGRSVCTATNEAKLRVAGQPRITEKEGAPEGEMAFDAVFEVYPEVKMPDLASFGN